jgi:hypothetical protein
LNASFSFRSAAACLAFAYEVSLHVCRKFPSVDIQDKKDIFGWLAAQICKEPIREVLIGLTALGTLLRRNEFREAFWKEGGLDALRSVIRVEQTNVQVLYQGVYALWLLSYHKDIRKTMTDPILVSNLVDILKHVTKDKVIRMSIATLRVRLKCFFLFPALPLLTTMPCLCYVEHLGPR